MTNTCQLQRGFFVMRSCPAPATMQCMTCQRAMCPLHTSSDMTNCVECARTESDEEYDDNWVYSYREDYYEEGYEPFKHTDEDYTSFDTANDGTEIWDDDYSGDFHDS